MPSSDKPPGVLARDFTISPYSDDEKRIVNWMNKIANGTIGGGDDPLGFFMASYEMLIGERKIMKLEINALKLNNERLVKLASSEPEEDYSNVEDGR